MATLTPAMLLLDLTLLQLGIESVPVIQRLSPTTRIVLFSSNPDEREAVSALKAGARGYHGRNIDPYLLKKAVQMVQQGEIWVGRNVIPHLLSELTSLTERRKRDAPAKPDGRLARLTPREREITHLIGDGASNKEISSQLNITEKTVKAHLTAIFRKLGFSDRLRLALFVSEHSRLSR
jgi:DNA-binding NarL/FixJ family response regulator